MLGLAKGIVATVLGVGGVSGTVYGIAKATSSSWDSGPKKISPSEPILICNDSVDQWKIFLKGVAGKENNLGEGITLQVVRVFKGSGNKREVLWGNRVVGPNDWSNWRLNFKGKEISGLWFLEKGATAYHNTYLLEICESSQVELKDPVKNQGEHGGIEATNIRFTVDKSNCKDPYSEGCNIQFATGINLQWKQNFQPKVIYIP